MKTRSGFVSNSSSSSFIIVDSADKPPCPSCQREFPSVIDEIDRRESGYNYVRSCGKKNILDYYKSFQWIEPESTQKLEELLERITLQDGEKIALVEVSIHDESLNNIVRACRICVNTDDFYE